MCRTTQYVLDTCTTRRQTKHNMCRTPPYTRQKQNTIRTLMHVKTLNRTTQYVLDTSICKQKQITRNSERKDT